MEERKERLFIFPHCIYEHSYDYGIGSPLDYRWIKLLGAIKRLFIQRRTKEYGAELGGTARMG
jgi:hypothetical protein